MAKNGHSVIQSSSSMGKRAEILVTGRFAAALPITAPTDYSTPASLLQPCQNDDTRIGDRINLLSEAKSQTTASHIKHAVSLWRRIATEGMGWDVPEYLNQEFSLRSAAIESNMGLVAHLPKKIPATKVCIRKLFIAMTPTRVPM